MSHQKPQSSTKVPVLDDALNEKILDLSENEQRDYLFLVPSEQFPGRWYVDALHQEFFIDFEEVIGKYRTVSPATLAEFLSRCTDLGYKAVFEEDPFQILTAWDHLNDPPEFSLNSHMAETINGFLPFQLQGLNYLTKTPRGGFAVWSTGTGKTALTVGLIKKHIEIDGFDLAVCVCKRHSKIDTQRKLQSLGDLNSVILDGTPKKRQQLFEQIDEEIEAGSPAIVIVNYEKFRENTDEFIDLISDRKVVFIWDEMPTKLSNRDTRLYASVKSVLYDIKDSTVKWDKRRPYELRQYALSATPIENTPVGLLNQVRLIDPTIWPSIRKWEAKYVSGRDFFSKLPSTFRDLDLIGLEIEHITHQVDKKDPDIAALFPDVMEEVIYVDWSPQDRKLYDALQSIAKSMALEAEDGEGKAINALQLIGVLQMVCDAPSMVQKSAENRIEFEEALASFDEDDHDLLSDFVSGSEAAMRLLEGRTKPLTDEHCNKLDALCDLILTKHPDDKIIVFSKLSHYIQPIISQRFDELGIKYVVYRGTDLQRQKAKDEFRTDPDIQVFLSSDIGSDGIDLPEARINVNYDLPYTYARKVQRQNRNHRVNSEHESVVFYDLLMPDSVEDRVAEIVARKQGYHMEIFKGEIAEEAINARMTSEDLWYILTGED